MSEQPDAIDGRITRSLAEIEETYLRMLRIERALAAHSLTPLQLVLLQTVATHQGTKHRSIVARCESRSPNTVRSCSIR